jgi:E3 ubiquitin-protein ligase HECTD3
VIESNYCVAIKSQRGVVKPADEDAVQKLRSIHANWTLDHDEELAQFLATHTCTDNDNLGSIKNYVESINVSTFSVSIEYMHESYIIMFKLGRGGP